MAALIMPENAVITTLPVTISADSAVAEQNVRRIASQLGFEKKAEEELALVVAELASNLIKHAGRGTLTLSVVQSDGNYGIEIIAEDHGPGIADIEQSLADGYSTAGSLGYGMGTVNRLMDEMEIGSSAESGTRIVCKRWLRPSSTTGLRPYWEVGVATRARSFAPENGDAFIAHEADGVLLAGVIDGLGHGYLAQQAALAAQRYVQAHRHMPLEKIFAGASRACRGTRGAVMALARLEDSRISFVSVGNIEARVLGADEKVQLNVLRGIIGINEPSIRVQEHTWKENWLLVLHSDGLSTHWQWEDFPGLKYESAQKIARNLLHALAKPKDDATVLVARRARV
jgi:anti-sigma regulatory factor (Ser/Thr protein kinase)/serine/threonine protein phosphatase PrpC